MGKVGVSLRLMHLLLVLYIKDQILNKYLLISNEIIFLF